MTGDQGPAGDNGKPGMPGKMGIKPRVVRINPFILHSVVSSALFTLKTYIKCLRSYIQSKTLEDL